jgi:pimeloyl-ACP methyl ester carboxylesterase
MRAYSVDHRPSTGRTTEEAMSHGSAVEGKASRLDVRTADGTSLAVWVDGSGPPLVLVHGALSDHTTYGPLVSELRDGVTTFAMDRRGRGSSGDAAGYAIDREFEDVAAVVDAVATSAGGPVALWGFSYGADCAMGGAALTNNVGHLILYEPGLGSVVPAGSVDAVEAAIAAGDLEAAATALLVGIVEMSQEEVDLLRSSPVWPTRLAVVPTVPRELRAEADWVYRPGQFDAIAAPTLVLAGSESPPAQSSATRKAAAAVPGAQIRVLDGHGHMAAQTDPAMVADIIRTFISS